LDRGTTLSKRTTLTSSGVKSPIGYSHSARAWELWGKVEAAYLPRNSAGPFPVLLGVSPYQKSLRHLPPVQATFAFIEYGPMQLYLDEGYAHVAMDTPGMGRSEGVWYPVSRTEGEAIHDMIEHAAGLDWSIGKIGMIGMLHYCWSQWNAARTQPPHLTCLGADARAAALEPHRAGPADRPAQHGLQRGPSCPQPKEKS